ncbi:BMP family ABC transporter substrate-binding protein [Butyrivibrio sp. JL13D10]|uniref:BMP family ABC transporter substrate-binding protein n=1 Tax=Butyrivibrio sp. JL13D10 TaxID=3236815 RepID=UPI0038B567D2
MKTIKNNIWLIICIILLIILTGLVIGLVSLVKGEDSKKIVVGAVFIDDVNDSGWNEYHYNGLKKVCIDLGLRLEIATNIAETRESAEPAIDELVQKGCSTIFLTSEGFGSNLYPVMEKYKDVVFYTVSPESDVSNANTYFCRLSEVRYLSGIVAGKMTSSNVIGFVAGGKNGQTGRSINAFTLGVRSVNPKAVVKVKYLTSWTDPEGEYQAAKELIEQDGADIITYHASIHTAIDAAEDLGAYSIGYNKVSKSYSDRELTAVACNWEIVYKTMLDDYIKGANTSDQMYWIGMNSGAVKMTEYSRLVPDDVRSLVNENAKRLIRGDGVFQGDIISNTGKVMCRKGERISDVALLTKMDWLVEGVEIDE